MTVSQDVTLLAWFAAGSSMKGMDLAWDSKRFVVRPHIGGAARAVSAPGLVRAWDAAGELAWVSGAAHQWALDTARGLEAAASGTPPAPAASPAKPMLSRVHLDSEPGAGVLRRWAAFFIDLAFLYLLTALPDAWTQAGVMILPPALILVIIGFLYFTILEALFGTTLGKLVMWLRVIRVDDPLGEKPGWLGAGIRNMMKMGSLLVPFGLLVTAVVLSRDPDHQRWGDQAAKTKVVDKRRLQLAKPKGDRRGGRSILAGVGASVGILVVLGVAAVFVFGPYLTTGTSAVGPTSQTPTTYSSSQYGFELTYPAGFAQIDENPTATPAWADFMTTFADPGSLDEAKAHNEFVDEIVLAMERLPRALSRSEAQDALRQAGKALRASFGGAGFTDSVVLGSQMTSQSGVPCYVTEMTSGNAKGGRQHDKYYMLIKDDTYYVIQLSAAQDRWQASRPALETAVDSFRLL